MTAAFPFWVMPMNDFGSVAECMALMAAVTEPDVEFLNPTGTDRPDASSLWG